MLFWSVSSVCSVSTGSFFFVACWQLCLFYVSVTRTPPPDPFPAPLDDGKFSHHVLSYAHSVVSLVSVHGVEIEWAHCSCQQAYFRELLILSTITIRCGCDVSHYIMVIIILPEGICFILFYSNKRKLKPILKIVLSCASDTSSGRDGKT
jgi:hypothetical protein